MTRLTMPLAAIMNSSSPMPPKQLIVVAGPNGAGKSTFALKYAAVHGIAYLGADAIAYEMAPDDAASVRVAAGREFLRRVGEAIRGTESLVVESTLAGRSFVRLLKDARRLGFEISIMYLFLDSVETCLRRVDERVSKGGHDVPPDDVRRRFGRSLKNFWTLYRLLTDDWTLVYNSGDEVQDVAIGEIGQFTVRDRERFDDFLRLMSET